MTSEFQLSPAIMLPEEQEQEGGLHLDRLFAALKRHVLLIAGVTTITASAAVLKAVTDVPTYQASFELLTPPVTLETQIISTLNPEALSNQSDVVSVAIDETKLKILTSPRVMEPVVETVRERYPNVSYGAIVGNLRILPSSTGDTLTVQYQSTDPEQVVYVLDIISDAYLEYSLEDRQNDIFRGIDFVDEQLPIVRERVNALEAELESLRQRSNLIDPLLQGEQLSQQTARFTGEQLDLRVQIQQAESLYQNLQQELAQGEEMAANSVLLESARYQVLLDQLLEIDTQLAQDLTLYLEDSPEIEVTEEQRTNLQPLLRREGIRAQEQLANYILELRDQDQALSTTIETLNQRIKRLSTVARQYNDLQRELEIATANLNQFLTKREALRIDAAQRQTPWEILTPTSNPQASAASAKRNLVLGTALGLLLGAGAAIVVDRTSGKIHTVKELKEAAQLPLLATIPYNQMLADVRSFSLSMSQLGEMGFDLNLFSPENKAAKQGQASGPFFEAFRMLSTSIRLKSPDNPIRAIAISSAVPNSGKSTISFYLGHAIAAMGQRVLIVDTDLRRPTLHELCNVSNAKGLSNYVVGEFDLDDIVVSLPTDENLYMVPAGPISPDPVRILSARRMEDFFRQVYEIFDMVIFDTPPILGFADALVVAAKTQGILLTANLGHVKFSQIQSMLDELQVAKIPIVGMVANGSKQETENSYSYYGYYQRVVEESNEMLDAASHSNPEAKPSWHEALLNPLSRNTGNKR